MNDTSDVNRISVSYAVEVEKDDYVKNRFDTAFYFVDTDRVIGQFQVISFEIVLTTMCIKVRENWRIY